MSARDRTRRGPALRCPHPRGARYPHLHLAERAATEQARHGRRTRPRFCGCGGFHLDDGKDSR